jgi:hypothetical protein
MNNKFWIKVFVAVLIIAAWAVCAKAMDWAPVTSFDHTWITGSQGCSASNVVTNGSTINMSAQGSDTRCAAMLYKTGTNGVIGMSATLQVDKISGYGTIGIQGSFGQIGDSKIQVQVGLEQYNNHKSIKYSIEIIDLKTDSRVFLSDGSIGDWDYCWIPGDKKTVAFAIVGSEVIIYVEGYPLLLKFQMLGEIIPYNGPPAVLSWTDTGIENSISGSVSNISLIYP